MKAAGHQSLAKTICGPKLRKMKPLWWLVKKAGGLFGQFGFVYKSDGPENEIPVRACLKSIFTRFFFDIFAPQTMCQKSVHIRF